MAQFIQYPIYIGDDTLSKTYVYANGIISAEAGYKCMAKFVSSATSTTAVSCRISGNYYVLGSTNTSISYSNAESASPALSLLVNTPYLNTGIYYKDNASSACVPDGSGSLENFSSLSNAITAFMTAFDPSDKVNIKVAANGAIVTCPSFVQIGSNVTAYVAPALGATVSADNISITRGGSPITFNYANGVLTFTAG